MNLEKTKLILNDKGELEYVPITELEAVERWENLQDYKQKVREWKILRAKLP